MDRKSCRVYYADFEVFTFIIKDEESFSQSSLSPILSREITPLKRPTRSVLIASELILCFLGDCKPNYSSQFIVFRHTAVDVDVKPKEAEKPSPPPPPAYTNHAPLRAPPDPPTDQQSPTAVIVKPVPSLRNLSEDRLTPENKVVKVRDVVNKSGGASLPCRVFLQSKSVAAEHCGVGGGASNSNGRPIYPNCPFSPYGSPSGSPRSNRKRQPLKESRRVSIEKSGMYIQLNQYKLMDAIGQVKKLLFLINFKVLSWLKRPAHSQFYNTQQTLPPLAETTVLA